MVRRASRLRETSCSRRTFLALAAFSVGCSAPYSVKGSHDEVHAWGGQGFRDGEFLRPRAIGCRDDRVYVVDTTGRIQVFDETGASIRSWSTPSAENGTPTAVAFGVDGRVLIPDTHYHRILEYSPEGELIAQWGSYGSEPGRFIYPTGIAQTADGRYFVSEYGENAERVHVFGPDREYLRHWGGHGSASGQFNRAMALAASPDGVYVADTTNHRIQSFTHDGELAWIAGEAGDAPGQLKFPYDLARATDGTLVTAEYGNHRLSRFDGDGVCVGVYGAAGREAGRFNAPRGVAVSAGGRVFVADTDNHRVQSIPLEYLA